MQKVTQQVNINGQPFRADIITFTQHDKAFIKKLFDDWKDLDTRLKAVSTRGVNIHEGISESAFCLFFPNCVRVSKVHGNTSGSFDVLDLTTGRRIQIKACSTTNDLTTFGPRSIWDDLYFLDFSRMNGTFNVYLIPNNLIYQQGVNRNQTMRQQQAQNRRPRFSIMKKIIIPNNLSPVKVCRL